MKKILLQVPSVHFSNNRIFEAVDMNNGTECWRVLRQKFCDIGYKLVTADDVPVSEAASILYMDVTSFDGVYIRRKGIRALLRALVGLKTLRVWPIRSLYEEAKKTGIRENLLLLMLESGAVCPENYLPEAWEKFDRIYTWDDDLVDGKKFLKIHIPFPQKSPPAKRVTFSQKKLLANMTANKTSRKKNQLYDERRKAIEFFDKNFPNDFDLYGFRAVPHNATRMKRWFYFLYRQFKTFRGEPRDKIGTLANYKFVLAYENYHGINGYVTEKMLDVLVARSVPVYWGAENIEKYVDPECFIDRRKFKNNTELAKFLFSVTEEEYQKYIDAGERYLQSDNFKRFSSESFAETIISSLNLPRSADLH